MTPLTVSVQGLCRDYRIPLQKHQSVWKTLLGATKPLRALDQVSFGIPGGERVALLGRNGSGKSTLVKTLTGVIMPTSGQAAVLGFTPWQRKRAYLRRIGVMFGQKSLLFPDLTVRDAFRLYQVIYGLTSAALKENVKELDDYLDITRLLDRPVRKLSLGERMRCEVVAALVHRPDVIFLDEPTIGMDAETRHGLAQYLEQRIGPQQTLVVTTHELGLIRRLCSRVLVMSAGKLVHDLPLAKVRSLADQVRIEVRYRQIASPDLLQAAVADTRIVERQGDHLVIDCPVTEAERVRKQISQALDIVSLGTTEAPLDSLLERLVAVSDQVVSA